MRAQEFQSHYTAEDQEDTNYAKNIRRLPKQRHPNNNCSHGSDTRPYGVGGS